MAEEKQRRVWRRRDLGCRLSVQRPGTKGKEDRKGILRRGNKKIRSGEDQGNTVWQPHFPHPTTVDRLTIVPGIAVEPHRGFGGGIRREIGRLMSLGVVQRYRRVRVTLRRPERDGVTGELVPIIINYEECLVFHSPVAVDDALKASTVGTSSIKALLLPDAGPRR